MRLEVAITWPIQEGKMAKWVGIVVFLFSGALFAQDFPTTDLGEAGNLYVKKHFANYQSGQRICDKPKTNVKRVLLSGFAPFFGSTVNPSGEVLKNFGDFQQPKGDDVDTYGITREMKINNVGYQICFLVNVTMWDLAAAVVINEMQNFAPELVLMSGLGGSDLAFETGNINHATFSRGFDIDGDAITDSTPQEAYVLPPSDPGIPEISDLTWDANAARVAVEKDVEKLGETTVVPRAGHADNDYICNNIAFVVSVAALNTKVQLAGGLVILQPSLEITPKTGFLHYPSSIKTDKASLDAWTLILKKIISSQAK
jgi:pyrrolidone-carboxylate peptidase